MTLKVRRLDKNHDWTFGQGFANYATESEAIAQNVQTRLWSFTNDWFLDLEHGLPWLEHVLQTDGVSKITNYESNLDAKTRKLTIDITYLDIYGAENSASYRS